MTKPLSLAEFDAKLKSGTLSPAEHRRYLEVDPTSPVVRIRFRTGALRDIPPPMYNVDREVYLAQRAHQERQAAMRVDDDRPRVVAEGDSWFNLPPFIRPKAIADRMSSNGLVKVKNIAKWGHTLVEMLTKKEYLDAIRRFEADWFIFSGGGNDLQQSLALGQLVERYDRNRKITDCLSATGVTLLGQIAEGYRTLLNEIAINFPTLQCVCYGYDYPRPTVKGGKYIGQYLKKLDYPKTTWEAVGVVLIDRLTVAVAPAVNAFPNAQFLDCRKVTATHAFFDDMHPGKDGFEALTLSFERKFGVAIHASSLRLRGKRASPRQTAVAQHRPARPAHRSRAK